jgi:hypothetical protein
VTQPPTAPAQTSRLTVDVPDGDYQMLRLAAAASGKGVTISSLVRQMIHDYLENLEDQAGLALVAERRADPRPLVPGAQARAQFEAARQARR